MFAHATGTPLHSQVKV